MDIKKPKTKTVNFKNGDKTELTDVGIYYGAISSLMDGSASIKDIEEQIKQWERFNAYEFADGCLQAIKDYGAGVVQTIGNENAGPEI